MIKTNRRNFIKLATALGTAVISPSLARAQTFRDTPTQSILTRPIPSTGEQLPVMALGNSQAFRSGDYEVSREILNIFYSAGGKLIDTSGNSMLVLGQYMQEKNVNLFLATGINAENKQAGLQYIQQAKTIQSKKTIDLLQIMHTRDITTTWRNMMEWKEMGHTRYIGVAISRVGWYESVESLMKSSSIDFVQLNYSMLEPHAEQRLLPLAHDKGIAIIINRPFMNGRYFGVIRGRELPEWTLEFDCKSWAQFSLKWILSNPVINCVLTETANPKHVADNLGAGFGKLPDDQQRKKMLNYMKSI